MTPQTDDETRARWPGGDSQAITFLTEKGYRLTKIFSWVKPSPMHIVTPQERDAAQYLIEEWDYDGIEE